MTLCNLKFLNMPRTDKKPPKKSQFFKLVESFKSKISCNFFENFDQCSSRRLPDYTNPNALET